MLKSGKLRLRCCSKAYLMELEIRHGEHCKKMWETSCKKQPLKESI